MTTSTITIYNPASCYNDINNALNYSGDNVLLLSAAGPPGTVYTTGWGIALNIPGGVTLRGEAESASAIYGTIGAYGAYASIEKVAFQGQPNQSINVLDVGSANSGSVFRDCIFWAGNNTGETAGTDCMFENCYIGETYGQACCKESGANWFVRCKFDSTGVSGGVGGSYWGFWQTDAVNSGIIQEVHFDQCDFSSPYFNWAYVCIDGYNKAAVFHDQSTFATQIYMAGCLMHSYNACEMGGQVYNASSVDCTVCSSSTTNGGSVSVVNVTNTSGNWGIP